MSEAPEIPTCVTKLTDEQYAEYRRLHDRISHCGGDLYAEWYAATALANFLWETTARYGTQCCLPHITIDLAESVTV